MIYCIVFYLFSYCVTRNRWPVHMFVCDMEPNWNNNNNNNTGFRYAWFGSFFTLKTQKTQCYWSIWCFHSNHPNSSRQISLQQQQYQSENYQLDRLLYLRCKVVSLKWSSSLIVLPFRLSMPLPLLPNTLSWPQDSVGLN